MTKAIRVAGAQIHNVVGDLDGNAEKIAGAMQWAEKEGADVLVLPELALTGYPPADLTLHKDFVDQAEEVLQKVVRQSDLVTTVISTIDRVPPQRSWDSQDRHIAIAAKIVSGGEIRGTYHKCLLPTYGVFDEGRNIAPGQRPDALWRIGDVIVGVVICEDMWSGDGPPEAQSAAGAQILLVPNASPYHRGKAESRLQFAQAVARRNGVPLVYLNFFGGQDDVVFDGGSLVIDGDGGLRHRCREFAEDRFCINVPLPSRRTVSGPVTTVHTRPLQERVLDGQPDPETLADDLTMTWQALVVGTRDFAHKNGFSGAVLGLSGGIDAAITAAVAADALGAENVLGIGMPSATSPDDDHRDAKALATNLGIDYTVIPITPLQDALAAALKPRLGQRTATETQLDLEAWVRAAVLLGFADEQGQLILTTGNKSELAIGRTAQGDLAGDFAPLRDCPKTLLYELGKWRNREREVIPEVVFSKQTTAQRMGEVSMPYSVLDRIVEGYLEQKAGLEELLAEGYDPDVMKAIMRRIDDAEFIRRQLPIGVKITAKAFDQDRRMPISNAWRSGGPWRGKASKSG